MQEYPLHDRVLTKIIEDNKSFANGIRNVLEIEGYRVRVDHEGVAGLAFALAEPASRTTGTAAAPAFTSERPTSP